MSVDAQSPSHCVSVHFRPSHAHCSVRAWCPSVCSVVEWCLLVCVLHVERKQVPAYNYAQLHAEYCGYTAAQSSSAVESFSPSLCLASFERLLARGLLVLEGSRGPMDCSLCLPGLVDRHFLPVRRAVGVEELEDCLASSQLSVPQWVRTWALKETTA